MTPQNDAVPSSKLPANARLQRIAFPVEASPGQTVLLAFPAPLNRLAVLVGEGAAPETTHAVDELLFLSIPAPLEEDPDLLTQARTWADSAKEATPSQLVLLQGAQLVWSPDRVAVIAPADRLEAVRKAVIESAFYDAELRGIERELGAFWPDLEKDAPLAFEFNEKSVRDRRRLSERFQRILTLRARLARLTPHVLSPHLHPPTLASQIGERLRERARLTHRVESLAGQLDVFERIYENCGQRASDFMLARTGHLLEWVIILLLLTQTILVSIDLLASSGR